MELQITQTRHPTSVKDGQTDRWSGPTTRPAFAKASATQVKNITDTFGKTIEISWKILPKNTLSVLILCKNLTFFGNQYFFFGLTQNTASRDTNMGKSYSGRLKLENLFIHVIMIPPGSCGRLPDLNPISHTPMRATKSPAFQILLSGQ